MVILLTAALFQAHFNLTDIQVRLAFSPNDLVDHGYRRTEPKYQKVKGIPDNIKLNKKPLDFPIERSCLRSIRWIVLIFIATTALYGFSLALTK